MDNIKYHIIALPILTISLILILCIKNKKGEAFVPTQPKTPIGNGSVPEAGQKINQPMIYQKQYYAARIPYQPKPNSPCADGVCGAMGVCQNGVCNESKVKSTVFGITV